MMMMKYIFAPRHNTHDNDCWCDAISLFTNQDYDTVYKLFKPFMEDNGTLSTSFINGYLSKLDYVCIDLDISLYMAIQLVDTKHGALFELENDNGSHIIYVKGHTIYDNIRKVQTTSYYADHTVRGVWLNIDNEFKRL